MITTVTNPTHLILSKQCELFYNTAKHFAPMGNCPTKRLAEVLDTFEAVDLAVEFRAANDEKELKRQLATYTKRMRSLPAYYNFTGFAPKVIEGFEQKVMTGRLTRCI